MRNLILILLATFMCNSALAVHNNNLDGVVKHVAVYSYGDFIYFTLENQPTSHPTCKHHYFVIPDSVSYERRQMMLSRLLMAYATKEVVRIGYDSKEDCAHGYIQAFMIG